MTKYSLNQKLGNPHIRYVAIIVFKTDKQTEMFHTFHRIQNTPYLTNTKTRKNAIVEYLDYQIPKLIIKKQERTL